MIDFFKKLQQKSKAERKTIFWILVIFLGIAFFGFWLLTVKRQVDSFNKDKIRQNFNLPQLEEQFKSLPKLELPEINQEDLKQIENLLKQEAVTPAP